MKLIGLEEHFVTERRPKGRRVRSASGPQVVTGHWGEVVLFYLERLEAMARVAELKRLVTEYFRHNISVTPSGMRSQRYLPWAVEVLGVERIMPRRTIPTDSRRMAERDASSNKPNSWPATRWPSPAEIGSGWSATSGDDDGARSLHSRLARKHPLVTETIDLGHALACHHGTGRRRTL